MEFFADCQPPRSTAQRKGVRVVRGKPVFYLKTEARAAIETIATAIAPHIPASPMDGPLFLSVRVVFPLLRKDGEGVELVYHDTKPDCSNLIKEIEDTMTKLGFWVDDARVVDLRVSKFRGIRPGIGIELKPVPAI
jgi:crossover junction endodeoxyribonuclease RusA